MAREYEELLLAGKHREIVDLLADEDVAPFGEGLRMHWFHGVRLQGGGYPDATLDSVRFLALYADTARVAVYTTRTPPVDTLTLVRQDTGWKVWLQLRERERITRLAHRMWQGESPWESPSLEERAANARAFLEAARAHPAFAQESAIEDATGFLTLEMYKDSIALADFRTVRTRAGVRTRGRVVNRSGRHLQILEIRVRDPRDNIGNIILRDVGPGASVEVEQMTFPSLEPGPIKRATVTWIGVQPLPPLSQ